MLIIFTINCIIIKQKLLEILGNKGSSSHFKTFEINDSRGPPTITIQGQPCHRIGSLLPMSGKNANLHSYISLTEKMKSKIELMP